MGSGRFGFTANVEKGNTRHRFECTENPQLTADEIELADPLGRGIERDVFRMFHYSPIPVFKHQGERAEGPLIEMPLHFAADDCGTHNFS